MDARDATRVLTKAAAYDQRTVGQGDVIAWLDAIGDLDLHTCLVAVTRHYQNTRDRIMPADVRELVATITEEARREQLREQRRRLELQAPPEPHRGPVTDRSADVTALVRSVIAALPNATIADRIQERATLRARRERGRPEPTRRQRSRRQPDRNHDWPPPQTDDIAALATRYLIDGHTPVAVAERLAVSRGWCRKTLRRVRPAEEPS